MPLTPCVLLTVVTVDDDPRPWRDVVHAVYRDGADPDGFVVHVAEDPECPATALSIAMTASTPPCAHGITDMGETTEQGDDQ